MVWQRIGVEIDPDNQLGCVVDWKQGRNYRFRFFRCEESLNQTKDGYFDPLEGDLDAIQELMYSVQVLVMRHGQQQSQSSISVKT